MGRIFNIPNQVAGPSNQTINSLPVGGGRIFNKPDNPNVEPYNLKSWEQIKFGENSCNTIKEIPRTLYYFLPPSTREAIEKPSIGTILKAPPKSIIEFAAQVGGVIAQSIGGLVLSGIEKITGKPQKYEIPGVETVSEKLGLKEIPSVISSYQQQVEDLKKQGFSQDEAKALVGINAYLGLMPVAGRLTRTGLGVKTIEKITTKEVPFEETPAGIKAKISGDIKEAPEQIVRVERPIITTVKRIFGKTEKQKKFYDILQEHTDKFFEGRSELLSKEEPLNKALLDLNNQELADYSKFTQGFEVPKERITPKLKSAVGLWKKVNKEIEEYLISKGKLTKAQIEARRWKPIEKITGRTREELKAMGVNPIYYPYLAEDLLKKSDFIPATGKRTKGGYLKRFTGKLLQEDNYIKDPRIAIPRHRLQVFRDKMNNELVDAIKENFAETDKKIIKLYKTNPRFAEQMGVEEWKPSGTLRFYPTEKGVGITKKVESYWIPKEIAKELNKFYKPGVIEKTFRMTYDPLLDMWRVSVLGMVPRWLYNNLMGNIILAILGRTDPFAFIKSAREMIKPTGKIPEKGVFTKTYAGGEIPKIGQLGGLSREQTQFLRPIENWLNLLEQAKNYKGLRIPAIATQNLIKAWIALGKPIGFLNKVVENWFRGAMYISKTEGKFLGFQLDKPVPPAEGIKYVNEFLFDYTKLSRTERAIFRRALPFWNWMKNITAFSFKFPVKHPLRGLILGALLQDYVDYINEINQKEDKVKSVLRIKTDMTYEGKPLYLNIKSAIPFSDVFKTIPTNFETFGRFLTSNPVSKIFIERAFKINSFTGKPFAQPPEKQEFDEYGKPVLPVPPLKEHILQQFPPVKFFGREIPEAIKYKGKVLERYETGEPKIYRGQIQTTDILLDIFKYFGVSLSPIEVNKLRNSIEKKEKLQEIKSRRFEQQLKSGLEKLKNQ